MTWLEILTLILSNAPTIIRTVEEGIEYATKTWESVKAAYDQPADTITREQLLAQLDRIKASSAEIQAMD